MHPEISRYYQESFDEVNYGGLSGWAMRSMHRSLERGLEGTTYPRVLELGAGHGEHVEFVRHGFDEYVLSDLHDHGLDLDELSSRVPAGRGGRKLSFEVADVMDLPFASASFDRTVHGCVLHHLSDPEMALREIRRVLRPGGLATIYLPCDPGLLYMSTQRLTTARRQDRVLRLGRYSINRHYLRAKEHPNQYASLRPLVEEVFRGDVVTARDFPLPGAGYHLNYFTIFQARVA